MKKADLVKAVTKIAGSKKAAKGTVECVLHAISKALTEGDKVTLVGFGTFKVTKRAARTGRNPQTGKALKVKAKQVTKFIAGKSLKATVAAGKKATAKVSGTGGTGPRKEECQS